MHRNIIAQPSQETRKKTKRRNNIYSGPDQQSGRSAV